MLILTSRNLYKVMQGEYTYDTRRGACSGSTGALFSVPNPRIRSCADPVCAHVVVSRDH